MDVRSVIPTQQSLKLTLSAIFPCPGNNQCHFLRAVLTPDNSVTVVLGINASTHSPVEPAERQSRVIEIPLPEKLTCSGEFIPVKIVVVGAMPKTSTSLHESAIKTFSPITYTYLGRKEYLVDKEPVGTQVLFHHEHYDALLKQYTQPTPASVENAAMPKVPHRNGLRLFCDPVYALTFAGVATLSGGIMAANLLLRN